MFRPPGAPGNELRPWYRPKQPLPEPGGEPDERDGGEAPRRSYEDGPRLWHPDVLPDTAWRLVGGAAVVLYLAGAGLPWWRTSRQQCARLYPADGLGLREACEHVAVSGSRLAVWLALAGGVVMVARLTRLGPALADVVPVAAAGLADLLAVRALFHRPVGLHLTWSGPLAVLVLLGVLTVAAVQAVRAGDASLQDMAEEARERLADGRRPTVRLRGLLPPLRIWRRDDDPYYYRSWRRRRRRRRWLLAGVSLGALALIAHACAGLDTSTTPAPQLPAQGPQNGLGSAVPGNPPGWPQPAPSPSLVLPDGAELLTRARTSVAAARTVHIGVDQVAGAGVSLDAQLTADERAAGTITTPSLAIYDVRRVHGTCWVRGLPGHGVAAWVATCTIPPAAGAPALDVAALTSWRVMVASLPEPDGATTTGPESLGVMGSHRAWHVATPDGSAVYVDTGGTDPHPLRVTTRRGRLGVLQVDYDRWDDAVTITPTLIRLASPPPMAPTPAPTMRRIAGALRLIGVTRHGARRGVGALGSWTQSGAGTAAPNAVATQVPVREEGVAVVPDGQMALDLDGLPAPSAGLPGGYVDRTPHQMTGPVGRYARALAEACDRRAVELGETAGMQPPQWAAALGPVPADPSDRARWTRRAAVVAACREHYGHHLPADEPLGARPPRGNVPARQAWQAAWEALGRPEQVREAATLTDAQLRERVAAWRQEQSWAPDYVADELRRAEQAAAEYAARVEIARAEAASGRVPAAERDAHATRLAGYEQLAAGLAARRDELAEIDRARAAWYAETTPVREQAEHAAAELRRRGQDPNRVVQSRVMQDRDDDQRWVAPAQHEEHFGRDRSAGPEREAQARAERIDQLRQAARRQHEHSPAGQHPRRLADRLLDRRAAQETGRRRASQGRRKVAEQLARARRAVAEVQRRQAERARAAHADQQRRDAAGGCPAAAAARRRTRWSFPRSLRARLLL